LILLGLELRFLGSPASSQLLYRLRYRHSYSGIIGFHKSELEQNWLCVRQHVLSYKVQNGVSNAYRLVPVLYNIKNSLLFQWKIVATLGENLCIGSTEIYVLKKYLRIETENFFWKTCLRLFCKRPSKRFAVTVCIGTIATYKYAINFQQRLATQSLLQCLLLLPSSAPIDNHYKLIIVLT
jgi:hypothetical protein